SSSSSTRRSPATSASASSSADDASGGEPGHRAVGGRTRAGGGAGDRSRGGGGEGGVPSVAGARTFGPRAPAGHVGRGVRGEGAVRQRGADGAPCPGTGRATESGRAGGRDREQDRFVRSGSAVSGAVRGHQDR